ncbi:MAG: NAD(P)/FAD-dependent oxidoreductase [Proteobacteria bacterium]|nr:NAD(P)/FAD-dependent oxidoreductase [Pseudomonadota bacterium]
MVESVECAVIGAGVVGLGIARRLALAGREVVVLEAAETIGTETSSRNSEVIHAGIYYQAGSLKARLCVAGREALYRYCAERGIAHRRIGKLIVATSGEENPALERVLRKAEGNGVGDLRRLTPAEARAIEPELRCTGALLSPSTGIIDSHQLMLAYQGEAGDRGAAFAFRSPVLGGRVGEDGIDLDVGGAEGLTLRCRCVVNSAGLHAQAVARALHGLDPRHVPPRWMAKGSYYTLAGRAPFSRLVYPVPGPASLGVHVTIDLAGQCRFGPDAEWVEEIDYDVDPARATGFYAAVRRYWPGLKDGAILPGYAGIRPKVAKAGQEIDFVIQGPEAHGCRGLVNLFGIESPGLTASLALADEVALRLGIA